MLHNLNYSIFCENTTQGMHLYNGIFDSCFEPFGFGDGGINHTYEGKFYNLTFIGQHEHGSPLNTKKRKELERSVGYEFDNLGVEYYYTDPGNHFNMCDNTAIFYANHFKNYYKHSLTELHSALWVSERWQTYSHEFLYPIIIFEDMEVTNINFDHFIRWESWFQHLLVFKNFKVNIGEKALTNPLNNTEGSGLKLSNNFQLVNNTEEIGDHLKNCTRENIWNSYYCENDDLAVLCMNTHLRISKLVHVWREDGFHSTDFSRSQLVLDGDLQRVSWLVNLVETSPDRNNYLVKFDSTIPPKITYFLLGQEVDKGVRLRIEYQKPYSIHIYWKEERQDRRFFNSIESISEIPEVSTCGQNIWRYDENILELYISGECEIRAESVNSLMLSLSLDCTVTEFFSEGGPSTFLDSICGVLGIKRYRIRIVGIEEGSTDITAFIDQDVKYDIEGEEAKTSKTELRELKTSLVSAFKEGGLYFGWDIIKYTVIESFLGEEGVEVIAENTTGSNKEESKEWVLILILCLVFGLIFLLIITGVIIWRCKRRRAKVGESGTVEESEISSVQHTEESMGSSIQIFPFNRPPASTMNSQMQTEESFLPDVSTKHPTPRFKIGGNFPIFQLGPKRSNKYGKRIINQRSMSYHGGREIELEIEEGGPSKMETSRGEGESMEEGGMGLGTRGSFGVRRFKYDRGTDKLQDPIREIIPRKEKGKGSKGKGKGKGKGKKSKGKKVGVEYMQS